MRLLVYALVIFFSIVTSVNPVDNFVRSRYECFTKEVISKLKGIWVIDSFAKYIKKDEYYSQTKKIPDIWKGNKLEINDNEIKWQKPLFHANTNKEYIVSCKLSKASSYISRHFTFCQTCNEEDYKKDNVNQPFDLFIEISFDRCPDIPFLWSISITYFPDKKILEISDMISTSGALYLKKETLMEEIDFSTLENCRDSFERIDYLDNKFEYLGKSRLQKLEGEWEIFKIGDSFSFPRLSEKEKEDLMGKKISVSKEGFKFLSKSEVYSKYYYEYTCSSNRSLIMEDKFHLIKRIIGNHNWSYIENSFYFRHGLPLYIKTKDGIKAKEISDNRKVLYIDNPCQLTIFDSIIVIKNKTMILQMGRDYLYLFKIK